jgi:hypothetical protein
LSPLVIDRGIIDKLRQLAEQSKVDGDWFQTFVVVAVYLERFGDQEIRHYLETLHVSSPLIDKLLERKHLIEIAKYLLALEVIEKEEFATLEKLNHERNKFIHRRKKDPPLFGRDATRDYTPLIDEGIRILEEKLHAVSHVFSR